MFNQINCTCCFRLRPVAFGLAFGLTAMLMMLLVPMAPWGEGQIQADLWRMGFLTAGLGFAKGFIFGLVSAIFYNLFLCCVHCCKRNSTKECDISSEKKL